MRPTQAFEDISKPAEAPQIPEIIQNPKIEKQIPQTEEIISKPS